MPSHKQNIYISPFKAQGTSLKKGQDNCKGASSVQC